MAYHRFFEIRRAWSLDNKIDLVTECGSVCGRLSQAHFWFLEFYVFRRYSGTHSSQVHKRIQRIPPPTIYSSQYPVGFLEKSPSWLSALFSLTRRCSVQGIVDGCWLNLFHSISISGFVLESLQHGDVRHRGHLHTGALADYQGTSNVAMVSGQSIVIEPALDG